MITMKNFSIAILGFCTGVVVTAVACMMLWHQEIPAETEVWTTSSDLVLEGNILIPGGVDLVHDTWMPEGFARLKLYVNVEGADLEKFERRTEPKSQLRIPYWVVD